MKKGMPKLSNSKCQHCHPRKWTKGLKDRSVYIGGIMCILFKARKLTRSFWSTGTFRENLIHGYYRAPYHQEAHDGSPLQTVGEVLTELGSLIAKGLMGLWNKSG